MRLPLRFVALAVVSAALVAGWTAAATLGVTSTGLAAGGSAVGSCQTGSFSFSRAVDNTGAVTSVTVGAISQACAGATLLLTVSGLPAGGQYPSLVEVSGTVPSPCAGACSVAFSSLPSLTAASIGGYAAAVLGP